MRLMVYSHDSFGLGNIRRMLAICQHLLETIPELSILVISGSPVLHSFRMPKGLDYIKLPCLGRSQSGELSAKYLGTATDETVKLRSELIKATAINFKPDLLLVDKKPYALRGELKDTLQYLKVYYPQTKGVLLLRDILDTPEATIKEWHKHRYYEGTEMFYDQILVVGMPEIFDIAKEYQFPEAIAGKVRYCGYIRRQPGRQPRQILRQELQVNPDEQLVLVTPGGGGDGYRLVSTYLSGLAQLPFQHNIKSLIICGPEMPIIEREALHQVAAQYPQVQIQEFTDDMMSYMEAADAVVSMAGYNTICEILTFGKRAVVVPRTQPVKEQLIRAERMASLGLFKAIHPDVLMPENLMQAILEQLNNQNSPLPPGSCLDLDALHRVAYHLHTLLGKETQPRAGISYSYPSPYWLEVNSKSALSSENILPEELLKG